MRFPRHRFSVRRMMVAVGICAIVLALIARFPAWADGRRARFQITCDEHSWDYKILRGRRLPEDARRMAYHGFMKEKYSRAIRYPWLPVWPDPPVPE